MISFKLVFHQDLNDFSYDFIPSFHQYKGGFGYEIYARNGKIECYLFVPKEYEHIAVSEIQRGNKGICIDISDHSLFSFMGNKEACNTNWLDVYYLTSTKHNVLPFSIEHKNVFHHLMKVFEKLESDEFIFIQNVFRPYEDEQWKDEFQQKISQIKNKETSLHNLSKDIFISFLQTIIKHVLSFIHSIVPSEEESYKDTSILNRMNKKIKEHGFQTIVKFFVYSPVSQKRKTYKELLEKVYQSIQGDNEIVLKKPLNKSQTIKQSIKRKPPLIRFRGQICSTSEIKNMIPYIHKDIEHEWIDKLTIENQLIDERITKNGLFIGYAKQRNAKTPVYMDDTDLDDISRVLLSIASPGWGKSTLAEWLFLQYAEKGHGAIVFDTTSGMLAKRCIELCPKERENDLIILDFVNDNVIFNMSALGDTDEELSESFIELFEYAFKTENLYRSTSYLTKLAIAVFSDKEATLLELEKFIEDDEFREKHLEKLKSKNPMIYMWWKQEYPKIKVRTHEYFLPILTRIQLLTNQKKMQNILCAKGGNIDVYKWMNEGKLIIVNLAEKFKEPQQRLLMSLWNYALWNATLKRGELLRQGIEPIPFHMFYDEPQTYMTATPMFDRAISKARKYRVSPKFFIQNAEQIIEQNSSLWKNIVAMNPHLFIGAVSDDMAKKIANDVGVPKEHILSIKQRKHHWLLRTFKNKQEIPSFVVQTLKPDDYYPKTDKQHIIERSRKIYAPYSSEKIQTQIGARRFNISEEEYKKEISPSPTTNERNKQREDGEWVINEKEEASAKVLPLPTIM